jgi:hypothetical protein
MCQVSLAKSDLKNVAAKISTLVFGSNNNDIWNIVNGLTRSDDISKDYTFGRVRGFLAEQADQDFFLNEMGHGHNVAGAFKIHVINTNKLNATQMKERNKELKANPDSAATIRYFAAVESIKNVFGYDLLKEKKCK